LNSYKSGIPADIPTSLIPQIKTYISTTDISLLSQAMSTLSLLLELAPSVTFPEVEHDLLNDIYNVTHSPLISGFALESLFRFYSSLVQADNQIATHVVPNLVISAEKAPRAESSPANVAKCVAKVVKSQLAVAAGTIAEYAKHLRPSHKSKPSLVTLSLLIMGELGRFMFVSYTPMSVLFLLSTVIWRLKSIFSSLLSITSVSSRKRYELRPPFLLEILP